MNQRDYKLTEEYKQCSKIQRLWIDLSIAMNDVGPGEDIAIRRTEPWNSNDMKIKAAWDALTSPDNIDLLMEHSKQELNGAAAKATAKAIEDCIKKIKTNKQKHVIAGQPGST